MQDSTFLALIIYVLSRIVKHSNLTIFLERVFESRLFNEQNNKKSRMLSTRESFGGDDQI